MDYSLVHYEYPYNHINKKVLILVVMDYSLVQAVRLLSWWELDCLNPCCNGL